MPLPIDATATVFTLLSQVHCRLWTFWPAGQWSNRSFQCSGRRVWGPCLHIHKCWSFPHLWSSFFGAGILLGCVMQRVQLVPWLHEPALMVCTANCCNRDSAYLCRKCALQVMERTAGWEMGRRLITMFPSLSLRTTHSLPSRLRVFTLVGLILQGRHSAGVSWAACAAFARL